MAEYLAIAAEAGELLVAAKAAADGISEGIDKVKELSSGIKDIYDKLFDEYAGYKPAVKADFANSNSFVPLKAVNHLLVRLLTLNYALYGNRVIAQSFVLALHRASHDFKSERIDKHLNYVRLASVPCLENLTDLVTAISYPINDHCIDKVNNDKYYNAVKKLMSYISDASNLWDRTRIETHFGLRW